MSPKSLLATPFLLALMFGLLPAAQAANAPAPNDFQPKESFQATIKQVVEADLLRIRALGSRAQLGDQEAFLLGSDTPEAGQGAWTDKARAYVKGLVEGKELRITLDAQPRSRCQRLRIYVSLPDGSMLNERLLKDGWAQLISKAPNLTHDASFRKAEAEAKAAGRGIWAREGGLDILPADYRHGVRTPCAH